MRLSKSCYVHSENIVAQVQNPTPLTYLQQIYGFDAFRDHQEIIIDRVLSGEHTLLIMPTGGGKIVVLSDTSADSRRSWYYRIPADCTYAGPGSRLEATGYKSCFPKFKPHAKRTTAGGASCQRRELLIFFMLHPNGSCQ